MPLIADKLGQLHINSTTYDRLPLDFMGKDKDSPFSGLSVLTRLFLGHIHTQNKICAGFAKIPYSQFMAIFGSSRPTVRKTLKELTDRGIIKTAGRSRYEIIPIYSAKRHLKIDRYLYVERYDDGNGVMRRLPRSSVLVYALTNFEQLSGKVFYSSKNNFSKALNLPESTAAYGTQRVIAAGLVERDFDVKTVCGQTGFKCNPYFLAIKRSVPTRAEIRAARGEYLDYMQSEAERARKARELAYVKGLATERLDEVLIKTDTTYAELRRQKMENLKQLFNVSAEQRPRVEEIFDLREQARKNALYAYLNEIGISPDDLPKEI